MNVLSRMHRKLLWEGYFFFGLLFLLITTTGLDHQVTGVIKPEVSFDIFIVYALWMTLVNQAAAILIDIIFWLHSSSRSKYLLFLLHWSVTWVWIGGALDILYFAFVGWFPSNIWYWMPFYWWLGIEWSTVHQVIYTLANLVVLGLLWYIEKHRERGWSRASWKYMLLEREDVTREGGL